MATKEYRPLSRIYTYKGIKFRKSEFYHNEFYEVYVTGSWYFTEQTSIAGMKKYINTVLLGKMGYAPAQQEFYRT